MGSLDSSLRLNSSSPRDDKETDRLIDQEQDGLSTAHVAVDIPNK